MLVLPYYIIIVAKTECHFCEETRLWNIFVNSGGFSIKKDLYIVTQLVQLKLNFS